MEDELKPCPRCGSNISFIASGKDGKWAVCCIRNGCVIAGGHSTKKEAIKAWNSRGEGIPRKGTDEPERPPD